MWTDSGKVNSQGKGHFNEMQLVVGSFIGHELLGTWVLLSIVSFKFYGG